MKPNMTLEEIDELFNELDSNYAAGQLRILHMQRDMICSTEIADWEIANRAVEVGEVERAKKVFEATPIEYLEKMFVIIVAKIVAEANYYDEKGNIDVEKFLSITKLVQPHAELMDFYYRIHHVISTIESINNLTESV